MAGKKQGVTKRKASTPVGRLKITKIELFRKYTEIVKECNDNMKLMPQNTDFESITYREAKIASTEYQETWKTLKETYFKCWTTKPGFINDFKLS